MAELSQLERAAIRRLRDERVFQDVEDNRLLDVNGIILLGCPDGDEFPEIWDYHVKKMKLHGFRDRIHPLPRHGGGIILSPSSPFRRSLGDDLIEELKEAQQFKGINAVRDSAHAPCTKAGGSGLTVPEMVLLHLEGKARILRETKGLDVSLFFHVDYGDRKRYYYVSRTMWERAGGLPAFQVPVAV